MKVVYIAHPIGGDVCGNIKRIELILKTIFRKCSGVYPVAPYLAACDFLHDHNEQHRRFGMAFNRRMLESGAIDELWVCHERISEGVMQEIKWARQFEIPVRYLAEELNHLRSGVRL